MGVWVYELPWSELKFRLRYKNSLEYQTGAATKLAGWRNSSSEDCLSAITAGLLDLNACSGRRRRLAPTCQRSVALRDNEERCCAEEGIPRTPVQS